ncbi:MAG: O-antigen ligase family protein [Planctomycetales bacterium]|nr:O-antigen ligase family protein [Planctomycetales bacterium]
MAKRRKALPAPAASLPLSSSARPSEKRDAGSVRWWRAAAFLLGSLLVWSLLSPLDATSVFNGAGIPQNLFWLTLAVVTTVAAAVSGVCFQFSRASWAIVGVCLLWLIASTLWAGRENNARVGWNGFWQLMALAACYFSSRELLCGPRSRSAALIILLVGCIALAGHGLYQMAVSFPLDRAQYEANPDVVLRTIGLDAPEGSADRKRFEDRLYSPEPYATFALANSLGTLLSGGLLLLLGLFVEGRSGAAGRAAFAGKTAKRGAVWAWMPWLVAAALISSCWFFTLSRAAYVGLGVGVVFWLLLRRSQLGSARWRSGEKYALAGVAGGGLFLLLGLLWLLQHNPHVLSEAPKSIAYRLEYWLATLDMLQDHWLFGVGLGNFQSYYPQYKLPLASETIADPHNWILDVLVTLSVPVGGGILLWVGGRLSGLSWGARGDGSQGADSAAMGLSPAAGRELDATVAGYLLGGSIFGGALCGLGLTLLSGLNLPAMALAWAVAGLLGWMLWPAMCGLNEARQSLLARGACVTLLTCLLSSGSWQASGIAVPLLVLLGMTSLSPAGSCWGRRGVARWAVCALPVVGLLCFVQQCWLPTTRSWTLMQQALAEGVPHRQLRLADAAAEADPLDAEAVGWAARQLTAQATVAPASGFEPLAREAAMRLEQWLQADSAKAFNWQVAGREALQLAAAARRHGIAEGEWLDLASSYYRQAVKRYPSSAALHAQLAATLDLAGQGPEAHRELQRAEELSQATPHADKQLGTQLLWLPLLPPAAEEELGGAKPWIPAELWAAWRRKHNSGS